MSFEIREGQGGLFVNKRKEGDQPDYHGNVRIGGVLYRLAGWRREGRSGHQWLALKIEPDGQRSPPASRERAPTTPQRDDFDDDIPF